MNLRKVLAALTGFLCLSLLCAWAEVPPNINYQGTLTDSSGNPITGIRSIQFLLYSVSSGGIALWNETQPSVIITEGLFSVSLGSVTPLPPHLFDGSTRWLGIRVSPDLAELTPRQPLVTVPYGFKSEEADHANQADTSHYAYSAGTASTASFAAQASNATHAIRADTAQFAVSATPDNDWTISGSNIYRLTGNIGIGTATPAHKLDVAGNVNADSLYKIRGNTVLSVSGSKNLMVGKGAGTNNVGVEGVFVGDSTGYNNQGGANTFLGYAAGRLNTTGDVNTFLGYGAGYDNTSGRANTFVGTHAGMQNTGSFNVYLGASAGPNNITGSNNVFLGTNTGLFNTGGSGNVFLGNQAGQTESGSNKLVVANGPNNSDVLIYGDFGTDRIGLGTTNPDVALQIGSGTHSPQFSNSTVQLDYDDTNQHALEIFNNSGSSFFGINTSGHAVIGGSTYGKNFYISAGGNPVESFLGASGFVGIGTLTPTTALQVNGVIYSSSGGVKFPDGSTQTTAATMSGSGTANYLPKFTGTTTLSNSTIYQSGTNIGIGTTNPSQLLHIYGTSNPKILVEAPSSATPELNLKRGTENYNLFMTSSNDLAFFRNGTKVTFANNGNVGIGTTNPDVPLQIGNGTHYPHFIGYTQMQLDYDDTDAHVIEIQNNLGQTYLSVNADGSASVGSASLGRDLYLDVANEAYGPVGAILKGTTGYFGIGTYSPSRLLHIYGATNPRILVESPSGQAPEINLQRGTTTHAMYINSGNDLVFYQAGDRVTFTDDGKVGVGTTAPTHQLTVNAAGTDDVLRLVGPDGGGLGYGARLNFGDGDYVYLDEDTDDHLDIHGGGGIALTGGEVSVQTMNATTSGSNVMWYNGKLYYYGSSEKYKDDIKPLKDDYDKLLNAEPVSFTDKVSGERNIGFIAEEFEKLGLENLVVHRDGEPDGVKYELVSVYLLEMIKELKTENQELKHRIDAIENK